MAKRFLNKLTTLMAKLWKYITENDGRRISIGTALVISSLSYMWISTGENGALGFGDSLMPAIAFIAGLTIITRDFEKVSKILLKIGVETTKFVFAVFAVEFVIRLYTLCVILFNFLKKTGMLITGVIGIVFGGIALTICTCYNANISCKIICGIYMLISLFAFIKAYVFQSDDSNTQGE